MFLIRTAFWLTLIILLLPTTEEQQRQVYGTAEAAVQDIRTFCVRNPQVCESGKSAFDNFSQKAQFGARMLMDFVKDASRDDVAGGLEHGARPAARLSGQPRPEPTGTLTEDDLKVAWSAPKH
jgi:hypothetical protein